MLRLMHFSADFLLKDIQQQCDPAKMDAEIMSGAAPAVLVVLGWLSSHRA